MYITLLLLQMLSSPSACNSTETAYCSEQRKLCEGVCASYGMESTFKCKDEGERGHDACSVFCVSVFQACINATPVFSVYSWITTPWHCFH